MRKFNFTKIAQLFEELSKLTISANLDVVYFQRIQKSEFKKGSMQLKEKINNYYRKLPIRFSEKTIFDFEYLSKQSFALILQNAMGNLLMNNCSMLHHLYIPAEFYTLSKYAQFLYRKVIENRYNKDHEYPLEMVAQWLNLRNSTSTQLNKKVTDVLEELNQFGYIEYEFHPIRGHNWFRITKKRKNR
jgi:hypothetical protein